MQYYDNYWGPQLDLALQPQDGDGQQLPSAAESAQWLEEAAAAQWEDLAAANAAAMTEAEWANQSSGSGWEPEVEAAAPTMEAEQMAAPPPWRQQQMAVEPVGAPEKYLSAKEMAAETAANKIVNDNKKKEELAALKDRMAKALEERAAKKAKKAHPAGANFAFCK